MIGRIWKDGDIRRRPVLMGRGLDGYLISVHWHCVVLRVRGGAGLYRFAVAMARGKHLFPFRTEQLSPSAPMVLGSQGPGRVGRRRFFNNPPAPAGGFFFAGASDFFCRGFRGHQAHVCAPRGHPTVIGSAPHALSCPQTLRCPSFVSFCVPTRRSSS